MKISSGNFSRRIIAERKTVLRIARCSTCVEVTPYICNRYSSDNTIIRMVYTCVEVSPFWCFRSFARHSTPVLFSTHGKSEALLYFHVYSPASSCGLYFCIGIFVHQRVIVWSVRVGFTCVEVLVVGTGGRIAVHCNFLR